VLCGASALGDRARGGLHEVGTRVALSRQLWACRADAHWGAGARLRAWRSSGEQALTQLAAPGVW